MPRPDPFDEPEPRPDSQGQPDWLVGPDDGVDAERAAGQAPDTSFELHRPASRHLPEGLANREATGSTPKPPVRWTGASSSVPRLHEVAPTPPARPTHHAEPLAEPEEREDPEQGFLDSPAADRAPGVARPARRPAPAPEPFWVVAIDMLASDRRLQIGVGVAFVALLALVFWPRGGGGVSIAAIKHHPAAYEGRAVRVAGRIGDVFVVGQGYVFNLHQGRDTLVVFTRLRSPRTRERTTVVGSVSTGYLDGAARVAVFETEAP